MVSRITDRHRSIGDRASSRKLGDQMARAIDPVCGMVVDTDTALAKAKYNSQAYYFCSEQCAATFRADPERYAGEAGEAMEQHEPPYTREGGLTAPKFGAAGSGGAENEPMPERHRPQ
jgi:YHS domain-containing protein